MTGEKPTSGTQRHTAPAAAPTSCLLFLNQHMDAAELCSAGGGTAAVRTVRCPDREVANQDAAAVLRCGPERAVLAVADGFGGQPAGDQAARVALEALADSIRTSAGIDDLRGPVLDGFERANEAVLSLGVGAATTLAVAEVSGNSIRPYHVGDSTILIVGQRGKLKLQTLAHAPVAYAVESGMLAESEAMHHEDRHLVSNMVGSPEMRIDIGPSMPLSPRDTVLLGSDGVFDNLHLQEIVEIIRTGSPADAADGLISASSVRMASPTPGSPSKPDDATAILYRPAP